MNGTNGTNGTNGATGPQGPQGPQGDAGTANVFYSNWIYATNFNDVTVDNTLMKGGDLAAPGVTASMVTSGVILVYFTYGSGTFPLPYTSFAGGKANVISFYPRLTSSGGQKDQTIMIGRFTLDNSNTVALSTLLQYRYILIPGGRPVPPDGGINLWNGGVPTAEDGVLHLPSGEVVDVSDYEQMRAAFSIPEQGTNL